MFILKSHSSNRRLKAMMFLNECYIDKHRPGYNSNKYII